MRKSATTADVSSRLPDRYIAEAEGYVFWSSQLFRLVQGGSFPKGNPPETARPSGMTAPERAHDFIPLSYPRVPTSAHCELVPLGRTCSVLRSSCCVSGRSGGETEATGTIPAPTVCDMRKSATIRRLVRVAGQTAEAEGYVFWSSQLFRLVQGGSFPKGNPPETARPSGTTAPERAHDFIPLSYPRVPTSAHCELVPLGRTCSVLRSSCCVSGRSGGETEATGTIPAPTVCDMRKSATTAARPSGTAPERAHDFIPLSYPRVPTSAHCELVPLGRTSRPGCRTDDGTGTSPRFHPSLLSSGADIRPLRACSARISQRLRGMSFGRRSSFGLYKAAPFPREILRRPHVRPARRHRNEPTISSLSLILGCRHPPIASLFRSDGRAACSDLRVVCRDAVAVKRKRPAPFLRRRSAICARRSIGKCGYRMSACAGGVAENPAHATTIQTPIQCLQEMCIRKTSGQHLVRTRREAPEDARRRPPETGFRLLLLRVAVCLFRAFTV